VRNSLAILDLQLLHLGLKLFVRQLIPINLVALVIQRGAVRVQSCGKMNMLALRLRFSVFVDRILVVLIRDWAFLTSAQRRKISDHVRVWLEGMFRSGVRRLQNVRRVRWQKFAWRPIIVVVIVVHVFHSSHWLSGTRGDFWYGVPDRSSIHQLRKVWRRVGCRCTSHAVSADDAEEPTRFPWNGRNASSSSNGLGFFDARRAFEQSSPCPVTENNNSSHKADNHIALLRDNYRRASPATLRAHDTCTPIKKRVSVAKSRETSRNLSTQGRIQSLACTHDLMKLSLFVSRVHEFLNS
jgi:hypothetical protein